jgi:hypothetical protein
MKLTLHDVAQTCAWINTAAFERSRPRGGRFACRMKGSDLKAANERECTRIRDCGRRVATPLWTGGN